MIFAAFPFPPFFLPRCIDLSPSVSRSISSSSLSSCAFTYAYCIPYSLSLHAVIHPPHHHHTFIIRISSPMGSSRLTVLCTRPLLGMLFAPSHCFCLTPFFSSYIPLFFQVHRCAVYYICGFREHVRDIHKDICTWLVNICDRKRSQSGSL